MRINKLSVLKVLVLSLITQYSLLTTAQSAFKDPGFGARPMGLGGAFTAVADDINASLYNPAGIFITNSYSVGFMHAQLFAGLEDVELGLQHAAFIIPTSESGNFGVAYTRFASADDYSENALILTYAKDVNIKIVPEFYAGINLKQIGHTYGLDDRTINDPVFASGNSKSDLSVDIGWWAALSSSDEKETALGFMFKDINQPDIGLETEDKVPSELKIGVKQSISEMGSMRDFLLAADISYRNQPDESDQNKLNVHIGSEVWLVERLLGLRLGGNFRGIGAGFSVHKDFTSLTLRIDYSMLVPTAVQGTAGSHRIALTCSF